MVSPLVGVECPPAGGRGFPPGGGGASPLPEAGAFPLVGAEHPPLPGTGAFRLRAGRRAKARGFVTLSCDKVTKTHLREKTIPVFSLKNPSFRDEGCGGPFGTACFSFGMLHQHMPLPHRGLQGVRLLCGAGFMAISIQI